MDFHRIRSLTQNDSELTYCEPAHFLDLYQQLIFSFIIFFSKCYHFYYLLFRFLNLPEWDIYLGFNRVTEISSYYCIFTLTGSEMFSNYLITVSRILIMSFPTYPLQVVKNTSCQSCLTYFHAYYIQNSFRNRMVFVLTVHLCFQTQYKIYSTGSGILPLPMNNTGFQKNEKSYAILQNKECFLKLSVLLHEERQITAELYMNTETD